MGSVVFAPMSVESCKCPSLLSSESMQDQGFEASQIEEISRK